MKSDLDLNIKIFLTSISGERFWDVDVPPPPQLQIGVNINVLDMKQKSESSAEVPFILTVQYTPSMGQLTAKGRAGIDGTAEEIAQLKSGVQTNQLPTMVVQAVSSFVMGELVILSKSLGLPPPLPPMVPQTQLTQEGQQRFTI